MNLPPSDRVCPFCKEGDFDSVGLALHLEHKECDEYVQVVNSPEFNKHCNRAIKCSGVSSNLLTQKGCDAEQELLKALNSDLKKVFDSRMAEDIQQLLKKSQSI
jgi:hypothetical protein